jgi:hypothetical protein
MASLFLVYLATVYLDLACKAATFSLVTFGNFSFLSLINAYISPLLDLFIFFSRASNFFNLSIYLALL